MQRLLTDGKLHSRDKFTHAATTCISSVVDISGSVSFSVNKKYQNFGKPRSEVAIVTELLLAGVLRRQPKSGLNDTSPCRAKSKKKRKYRVLKM